MAKSSASSFVVEDELQSTLEDELCRLKKKLKLGHDLEVRWIPDFHEKLSGEVKDNTIYVYDKDKKEALATLRHEYLDYAMSKLIEPYSKVTNKLIELINEEAYRRKENLIDILINLL